MIDLKTRAGHLPDGIHHLVEEIAVMRDDQEWHLPTDAGSLPATPQRRYRGGWWARPGPTGLAPITAGVPAGLVCVRHLIDETAEPGIHRG